MDTDTPDRASATENEIHNNIADVLEGMRLASEKAGRKAEETQLLIVSKTWPVEMIRMATTYPFTHFGENRVQEVLEKAPMLHESLHWHLIGHLQKNKIRKIVSVCDTLQSVDSLELARRIDRIAEEEGARPNVYLQVNIADDGAKFGFSAAGVRAAIDALLTLQHIEILGLMTIPAFTPDPEDARPHFAALRRLRDELEATSGKRLPGLSMGMSGDFAVAIEEGSTIVRVGTAIFGKRQKPAAAAAD